MAVWGAFARGMCRWRRCRCRQSARLCIQRLPFARYSHWIVFGCGCRCRPICDFCTAVARKAWRRCSPLYMENIVEDIQIMHDSGRHSIATMRQYIYKYDAFHDATDAVVAISDGGLLSTIVQCCLFIRAPSLRNCDRKINRIDKSVTLKLSSDYMISSQTDICGSFFRQKKAWCSINGSSSCGSAAQHNDMKKKIAWTIIHTIIN